MQNPRHRSRWRSCSLLSPPARPPSLLANRATLCRVFQERHGPRQSLGLNSCPPENPVRPPPSTIGVANPSLLLLEVANTEPPLHREPVSLPSEAATSRSPPNLPPTPRCCSLLNHHHCHHLFIFLKPFPSCNSVRIEEAS